MLEFPFLSQRCPCAPLRASSIVTLFQGGLLEPRGLFVLSLSDGREWSKQPERLAGTSGRCPHGTRHGGGRQRGWPRGVTMGWSRARSDRRGHQGIREGRGRLESDGRRTMTTALTTSKRERKSTSDDGNGRGRRSPYSGKIHSDDHPCEAVAEGVLLRLSPGCRKCC